MTGIELIAVERHRQMSIEGFTLHTDDEQPPGDLTLAAIAYAHEGVALQGNWVNFPRVPAGGIPQSWPWSMSWWKPSDDPVRNLVKAGALIAAEIDRLQRRNAEKQVSVSDGESAPPSGSTAISASERSRVLRIGERLMWAPMVKLEKDIANIARTVGGLPAQPTEMVRMSPSQWTEVMGDIEFLHSLVTRLLPK